MSYQASITLYPGGKPLDVRVQKFSVVRTLVQLRPERYEGPEVSFAGSPEELIALGRSIIAAAEMAKGMEADESRYLEAARPKVTKEEPCLSDPRS